MTAAGCSRHDQDKMNSSNQVKPDVSAVLAKVQHDSNLAKPLMIDGTWPRYLSSMLCVALKGKAAKVRTERTGGGA
eukprot:155878-Karenia_brevis.AAC.1